MNAAHIDIGPSLLGYGYAILAGWLCIKAVTDTLWRGIGWKGHGDDQFRPEGRQAELTGVIERALFVTALLLQAPIMIGFWLALKVAGNWGKWSDDTEIEGVGGRIIPGRSVFQFFLAENALSVLFGAAGYALIAAQAGRRSLAVLGVFGLVVLCVGLIVCAERFAKTPQPKQPQSYGEPRREAPRQRSRGRRPYRRGSQTSG